jgi:hypothetical protein
VPHAGAQRLSGCSKPADDRAVLLAVAMADGINLGLTRMAETKRDMTLDASPGFTTGMPARTAMRAAQISRGGLGGSVACSLVFGVAAVTIETAYREQETRH